ncbi:MAG: hypothetical protein ABIQ41_12720, partial [Gemmatimonadales bacterium]
MLIPAWRVSKSLCRRLIGILLPIVLLTTCTGDGPLAPGQIAQGRFDLTGLFLAPGDFAIPIDQVVLELRRTNDSTLAFARTLTDSEFTAAPDQLVITVQVPLRADSEQFSFLASVRSGGVEFYRATDTVTAYAGQITTAAPVVPTYTGPGANANGLFFTLAANVLNGSTVPLSAVVSQNGSVLSGVPVSYSSSDTTLIKPVVTGINTATLRAPAIGSGSVTITARTPNGLSATGSFQWSPAVATALALISGDSQTVGIGGLTAPLVVEVRDGSGAPFTTGYPVTFAVLAGPVGTSVAPTTVLTNAQGRASATVTAGTAAGPIAVTATATGLSGSPVTFSTLVASVPSALAFVVPPSPTIAGVPITPAIQVAIQDVGGNTVTTATDTVVLAIASNPAGGTLSGTLAVAAVSGIATFTGLSLDRAATGYTLIATSGALTSATSAPFGITAAAAKALVFIGQPPASLIAGTPFITLVEARDSLGNTATGFSGNVTMAIGTNPGGTTLSGTTTIVAVAGVATFSDLSLPVPGVGYTLTAGSGALTPATSAAFDITIQTIAWINPLGGSWSTAANWSLGRVPQSNDSVVIALAGTYTVTLDVDTTVRSLTLGGITGTQTLAASLHTLTFGGASTIGTNGVLSLSSSTVAGPGSVTNQGTVNLSASTVSTSLSNQGVLGVDGNSTVSGPLTTASGSTLQVAGGGNVACIGPPCVNLGDAVLTVANGFTNNGAIGLTAASSGYGATLVVSSGTLTNAATGTITALPGAQASGPRTLTAQLDNQGTVTVSQSLTINQASAAHTNSGAIDVSGGDLTLTQSGTSPSFTNSGTVTIGTGRTWTVNTGTFAQNAGTLGGSGALVLNSVTAAINTAQTLATLTLNGSTIDGGTLIIGSGQTLALNASTIAATSALSDQGIVVVQGNSMVSGALTTASGSTLQVAGGGNVACIGPPCVNLGDAVLTVANGFTNNGAIGLTAASSGYGATLVVTSGTLTNAATGTITALPGAQASGPRTLTAQLDNQGTVTVNQSLTINQTSAAHTTSGTIDVSGGDLTLTQSGTSPSFTNSGTVTIGTVRTWTVTGGAFTNASGGTLQGTGTLDLTGGVTPTMAGIINPGTSPGILSVTGALPLQATAALNIELGGTIAGTQYDRLAVSGAATFDGTLNVTLTGGFAPALNDQFTVLTCGTSCGGAFATVNLPPGMTIANNGTALVITQVTVAAVVNYWTNVAGGTWNTPANWSLGRVPQSTDSVVIALAGTYTVTLDTTFSAAFLTLGGATGTQTLSLSSRTLTVTGALTVKSSGVFTTTSSTVTGPGILVNQGTLNLSGSTVNAALDNQGLLVFGGTGSFAGGLTTVAGSTLRLQGSSVSSTANLTVATGFTNLGALELTD